MTHESGRERGRGESVVLLAAGVADLAVGGLTAALGRVRGVLGRADLADVAGEGRQELRARGRLFLDRHTATPPAHLEVLARHVEARRARDGDA